MQKEPQYCKYNSHDVLFIPPGYRLDMPLVAVTPAFEKRRMAATNEALVRGFLFSSMLFYFLFKKKLE